jgi:O-antigen ligase
MVSSTRVLQACLFLGGALCGLGSYTLGLMLPPWPAFHHEALHASAWLCVLCLLALQGGLQWPMLASVVAWLASLPFFNAALNATAPFWGDVALASLYLLALGVCVAMGYSTAHQHKALPALAGVWVVAATCTFLTQTAQWLGVDALPWSVLGLFQDRPAGHLFQANHAATLLLLGLAGVWLLQARGWLGWPLAALLALGMGFGLGLSASRTGVLALVLVLFWLAWVALRQRPQKTFSQAWFTLAFAALAGFLLQSLLAMVLAAFFPTAEWFGQRPQWANNNRLVFWQALWAALWAEPWLGYGWGGVARAYASQALHFPATTEWIEYSHNMWIDWLVWNGLPMGLVCVLALWGALGWWGWRTVAWLRLPPTAPQPHLLPQAVPSGGLFCTTRGAHLAALWAFLSPLLVHASLEYPLAYSYFLLPFGFLLGQLAHLAQPPAQAFKPAPYPLNGVHGVWRIPPMATLALATVATVLLAYWVHHSLNWSQYWLLRTTPALAASTPPAEAPQEPPPTVWFDHLALYTRTLLGPLNAHPLPPQEAASLEKLVLRSPNSALLLRSALALHLAGQHEAAEERLRLLCHTAPEPLCQQSRQAFQSLQTQRPNPPALPDASAPGP